MSINIDISKTVSLNPSLEIPRANRQVPERQRPPRPSSRALALKWLAVCVFMEFGSA